MTRYLSEELSTKLRNCITDDGVILTKKLEKSLTSEEQWSLVMAYMSKIRRAKLRHDTGSAIAAVKAALAISDLKAAGEAVERVYLSSDMPLPRMTLGEARERSRELSAISDGLSLAQHRLRLAINALEARFAGNDTSLGDLYSTELLIQLVAGMPE